MDIDFHYYATYKAALLAGWVDSDAETIAYAAQFVDEFDYNFGYGKKPWVFEYSQDLPEPRCGKLRFIPPDKSKLSGKKVGSEGKCFLIPRKTCQNDLSDFLLTKHTRTDIWMTYHFLPGNFDFSDAIGQNVPEYKNRAGASKLLCRPFSQTAISMVNDLLDYKTADYFLHLLGLRMHVFVDTWAHQDFVGNAEKSLNDCAGYYNFFETDDGNLQQVDWSMLNKILPKWVYSNTNVEYAPYTQYLGHGRLGHFPDFGWARFYYTPAWLNQKTMGEKWTGLRRGGTNVSMLERNNPIEFESAFFEMIKVLYAVKHNIEYPSDLLSLNRILSGKEDIYRTEFRKTNSLTGRAAALNSNVNVFEQSINKWKLFGSTLGLNSPPDFNIAKWRGVAKDKPFDYERVTTDSGIYRFNLASEHHYAYVRDLLKRNKIIDVRDWDDNSYPIFSKNVKWVADEDAPICMGTRCGTKFGTLTRRHHCRTCGGVFCNSCAPLGNTTNVRICNYCLTRHDPQIDEWVRKLVAYNEELARQMAANMYYM